MPGYNSLGLENCPKVFTISSGKGGVGKTTFALNISYALCERNEVLLFDADLGLANVDVLLGLSPKFHIGDVLAGRCQLEEVVLTGPRGLKILPASSGIVKLTNLSESQKMMLLDSFDRLTTGLDYVFLDTAAGISENVLYFNLASHERILICTPEPTALTDVYALIKVLFKYHYIKRFHLVVNMIKRPSQALEIYRQLLRVVEKFLGSISLNFLGGIPADRRVSEAIRAQVPLLELFPNSPASQAIREIALEIANMKTDKLEGGLQFFGRKIMGVCA
ncbi:cobyrinic acid ac-diamide synthase [Thermodesulfatator indicus DSM 15286]|uniref:Cobyrinic acid ac-diamide synthase n=1 Tax=Thermodesulfatator indicus (strain DSM 15286 / JCM 11887 / CIR29812) TaxID=667014 RepID=F8A9D3_THEID|nr:MinD/ParA family protein [Thermodesulfatator indicus]AEH44074.1 cobyrinic acid ac-diamide synthase [Thermodesulfatator indicus DSM 15286]